MTRNPTKELFTPFENPEREFYSSRKLFETPSLEESSSPEFDLFSDLKEHSEEEVVGKMAETMEEYMCKTREVPTRQMLDSKGAIPTKTAADAKVAIQEMAEYSLNGTTKHLRQAILKLLMD
ncbi:hypothetical protein Tco_1308951 [Tanacetum coccineum]